MGKWAITRPGTSGPVCFLHMTLKVTDAQLLIHEWQAAALTQSLLPVTKKARQPNKTFEIKDKGKPIFFTGSFLSGRVFHFLKVDSSGDSCEEKC